MCMRESPCQFIEVNKRQRNNIIHAGELTKDNAFVFD